PRNRRGKSVQTTSRRQPPGAGCGQEGNAIIRGPADPPPGRASRRYYSGNQVRHTSLKRERRTHTSLKRQRRGNAGALRSRFRLVCERRLALRSRFRLVCLSLAGVIGQETRGAGKGQPLPAPRAPRQGPITSSPSRSEQAPRLSAPSGGGRG